MSDLSEPLTPADCDLKDFQFIPVDVHRLLTSETWILGTGDERAASMTLWLASWHQVPAGSIPNNDRMLAHLSQAGEKWKKVRAHALRGWIEAKDGRLYHPVVAEKALEAWIEKLANSISGSVGNAKRWGVDIETDSIKERALAAIGMLRILAPQSKTLKKKVVAIIEAGSRPESVGDAKSSGGDIAVGSGGESGGDRKGQGQGQGLLKPISLSDLPPATASTVVGEANAESAGCSPGEISKAMRKHGVQSQPADPRILALVEQGVSLETVAAACEEAKASKPNESIGVGYVVAILQRWAKEAASLQATGAQAPTEKQPKAADEWWKSDASTDRKAREMGIQPRPTESYADLRSRIFDEIRKRGGKAA